MDGARIPFDTRLLEPFAVLADELHFTRAALRLHVAQPALSQQIARLEAQVGARLFTRPPAPVTLTPAGALLLQHARPALAGIRAAVDGLRDLADGRAGTVTLAHVSSLAARVVPEIAAAVAADAPGVELLLQEANIDEQLGALRHQTATVGLFAVNDDFAWEPEGFVVDVLATGPRFVALPADHPLAGAARIQLAALADAAWVLPVGTGTGTAGSQSRMFIETCRRHGFTPRVVHQANSAQAMVGLVASGLGATMVPWAVALDPVPGVALLPIDGERVDLVSVRAPDAGDAAGTVVKTARSVVSALAARFT